MANNLRSGFSRGQSIVAGWGSGGRADQRSPEAVAARRAHIEAQHEANFKRMADGAAAYARKRELEQRLKDAAAARKAAKGK